MTLESRVTSVIGRIGPGPGIRIMSIKLDGMSAKELEALIAQASQRKKQLAKRKPIALVKQKLAALAKAEGYSLSEIFGDGAAPATKATTNKQKKVTRTSSTKGSKVPAKYRNPANATQTWAGRGQQPNWLAAEIAKGKSLADFAIG
jgi:DNA-binding protein H-NS